MATAPEEYSDLSFYPNALSEKYREEREKRISPDGNAQYGRRTL